MIGRLSVAKSWLSWAAEEIYILGLAISEGVDEAIDILFDLCPVFLLVGVRLLFSSSAFS